MPPMEVRSACAERAVRGQGDRITAWRGCRPLLLHVTMQLGSPGMSITSIQPWVECFVQEGPCTALRPFHTLVLSLQPDVKPLISLGVHHLWAV